jgi:hypothetical protein
MYSARFLQFVADILFEQIMANCGAVFMSICLLKMSSAFQFDFETGYEFMQSYLALPHSKRIHPEHGQSIWEMEKCLQDRVLINEVKASKSLSILLQLQCTP